MEIRQQKQEVISNASYTKEFELPTEGVAKQIILQILTTNKYQNPLGAAIQETIANAVDAHRAAGEEDVPIEITLPTEYEPILKIRDFGYGMSPQTINEVYTVLGASDKRDTNRMQGGFGIGAASVLSVADQVQITTVHEGILYPAVLYLNEEGIPSIAGYASTATNLPSGTTIGIPVKETATLIYSIVRGICDYLEPKPVITNEATLNAQLQNQLPEPLYSGEVEIVNPHDQKPLVVDWAFLPGDSTKTHFQVVLDFVPYSYKLNAAANNTLFTVSPVSGRGRFQTFVLRFPIGSLDLVSSRETLQNNEYNSALIDLAFTKCQWDYLSVVSKLAEKEPNLESAAAFIAGTPLTTFTYRGRSYTADTRRVNREIRYLGFDGYADWRLDWTAMGRQQVEDLKVLLSTKSSSLPLELRHTRTYSALRKITYFRIAVAPLGMTLNTIRKKTDLPTEPLMFLRVEDPEEFSERNPVYKELGALIIPKLVEKPKKYRAPSDKALHQLAKGEGAVRQVYPDAYTAIRLRESVSGTLWNSLASAKGLPDSGYYIDSDTAKEFLANGLQIVADLLDDFYVVQPRVAQEIRIVNLVAEGKGLTPPWVDIQDVIKSRTLDFFHSYKDVFTRYKATPDQDAFSPYSADSNRLLSILKLPLVRQTVDPKGDLLALLKEPLLRRYQEHWSTYRLEHKSDLKIKPQGAIVPDNSLRHILNAAFERFPLLGYTTRDYVFAEFLESAKHYTELIAQSET